MNPYERRANLYPECVEYIVIHSTMTKPNEDGKASEAERQGVSPRMLGQHVYIDYDGVTDWLVPMHKRGTAMPRYVENSIVITIEGGVTEAGEYCKSTYGTDQLEALRSTLSVVTQKYPDAEVLLWCDLKLGVNPVITLDDITQ